MGKNKIIWTKSAKMDFAEIIEYIAQDSVEIALKKHEEIKNNILKLVNYPLQGRIIPELDKHNIIKYHELIISRWRVMYKVEENKIYIMAILDGRRNIEDILLKRQLR